MGASPQAPTKGYAVTFRFDVDVVVVLWGPGEGDHDVVANRWGAILTWPTVDACAAACAEHGWELVGEDAPLTVRVDRVAAWAGRGAVTLDPVEALSCWNLAADVGRVRGFPLRDGGRVADVVHAKLTTANVPWLDGLSGFTPRWTPGEVRRLRRVLAESVSVLRRSLLLDALPGGDAR